MDETGEKMIKREVSVKKEEDIDDESCVNVFGEDSVIVKNEEKEFEEENLLVNPDLLKEVMFYSNLKSLNHKSLLYGLPALHMLYISSCSRHRSTADFKM